MWAALTPISSSLSRTAGGLAQPPTGKHIQPAEDTLLGDCASVSHPPPHVFL